MDKSQREALSWTAREERSIPFEGVEIRERPDGTGGSVLDFEGYASVTSRSYKMHDMFGEYDETVRSGAFKNTINQGCDTAFLSNHGGLTMARTKSGTLQLAEDAKGLHTRAQLDPKRSDVADLRSAAERGDIDEMSFAFRTIRQEWSEDCDQRDLIELDLNRGDVSTVNFGASPHTAGISLRSMFARIADLSDLELEELRADPRVESFARKLILPPSVTDEEIAVPEEEIREPVAPEIELYVARMQAIRLRGRAS